MKDHINYFRGCIFEAKTTYNAWKMVAFSRWSSYVGKDLAEKYTEIQNYHKYFFGIVEHSLLRHWVTLVMHCFDNSKNALSLKKLSPKKYNLFINDTSNKKILKNLKNLRDTLFAHKSKKDSGKEVGGVEELEMFWKNLENFYNEICHDFDKSKTLFNNAEDIKYDIEHLFCNLERGENVKKTEIKIDWSWQKNPKRISNIL